MLQRAVDVVTAALLLLVLAPPLLLMALALGIEGAGPVLFRSPRAGRGGRTFHMLRFRTMVAAAPGGPALLPEERLTLVGRFLRSNSLDDLPNLVNVLRGEMSLVGPRPTEPEWVDMASEEWREILSVRPGMISPAVLRLAKTFNVAGQAERSAIERAYLRRRSAARDAALMGRALRALAASRGNVKARGETERDARKSGHGPPLHWQPVLYSFAANAAVPLGYALLRAETHLPPAAARTVLVIAGLVLFFAGFGLVRGERDAAAYVAMAPFGLAAGAVVGACIAHGRVSTPLLFALLSTLLPAVGYLFLAPPRGRR